MTILAWQPGKGSSLGQVAPSQKLLPCHAWLTAGLPKVHDSELVTVTWPGRPARIATAASPFACTCRLLMSRW